MIPKSVYNKLNKRDKQKVKNAISITKKKGGRSGAYIFDRKENPYGHYGEKIAKYTGYIPRSIGAYGGHLIGKLFGSGAYYNARGKYIPSYSGSHKIIQGSGAYYHAPKNVVTDSTSPPSFGSNRTIVRHREFIGNIQGSTGFAMNQFNLNPGDENTFPWLSALAANYEKYRPIGMIFEFKSTSATALNNTNTALGSVMMAPRYNAIASSVPETKMEMLQIENCVSVCPAESAMCGIECAKNYNPLGVLYIRNNNVSAVNNEQMYDFCDFYLATEGMQAVSTIGELWVTYEIELLTPILTAGVVGSQVNSAYFTATSGISTSNYFGTNKVDNANNNMSVQFTSNTITIAESNLAGSCYLLQYVLAGTANASGASPNFAATSNCTLLTVYASGDVNLNGPWTGNRCVLDVYFKITGSNPVITISGGTLPTSPTSMSLFIQQVPEDLVSP